MPASIPEETISIEAFRSELLAPTASPEERSPFEEFPPAALAWLAVAPAWPLALAMRALPSDLPVRELFEEMARDGICEARRSGATGADGEAVEYFMNAAQKAEARRFLRERRGMRTEDSRGHLLSASSAMRAAWKAEASEQLARAASAPCEAPPMDERLERWCALADHARDPREFADTLLAHVTAAIARAEEQRARAVPEVARWIETAEDLALWFPGTLDGPLVTARRKRELFHRRAYDHRLLANYFVRPAQDMAFHALLDGPDEQWALHYVGLGGTGKTMLLRHIAAHLGPERRLVMARIDFDHLNPDYPVRAPALFLDSLAEELRLYEDAGYRTSISAFARFDEQVKNLHDRIAASADAGQPPPEFAAQQLHDLLPVFCHALREVARDRRVLLVLDTCEELAKIRPDGTLPESVEVTFGVLRRIHDALPGLRVVFSGRRPLASEGAGWEWLGARGSQPLPERPYLRLHEILGFSEKEARDFLAIYELPVDGEPRRVAPALVDAILAQSRVSEHGRERRFGFESESAASAEETRFNPYDLDLFASWSCADRTLTPAQIAGGVHVYVRERILGRLSSPLRKHLAAVVVAGRFDRAILGSVLAGGEDAAGTAASGYAAAASARLVDELIDQEWIDLDRASPQEEPVWFIEPIMQRRLSNYYRQEAPAELGAVSPGVAALFTRITLERPWSALTPGYFEAVLRALHDAPEAAAEWWARVELRIAADAEWDWARSLTEALLIDEGESDAGAQSALRPAILALRAAERTHRGSNEAPAIWREVDAGIERHPTAEGRARLQARAWAGILAGPQWMTGDGEGYYTPARPIAAGVPLSFDLLRTAFHEWRELIGGASHAEAWTHQATASALAAIEARVEAIERGDSDGSPEAVGALRNFFAEIPIEPSPPHTDLFIEWCLLGARLAILAGEARLFRETAAQAIRALDSAENLAPQQWLDWHKPDDLRARALLEYLRLAYPRVSNPRETLATLDTPPADSADIESAAFVQWASWLSPECRNIDDDRLASARLTIECAFAAPLARSNPEDSLAASLALRHVAPSCNAHRAFPPFAIAALEAEGMRGRLNSAVNRLRTIRNSSADESRLDVAREAERAMMRLAIRFHLADEPGVTYGASLIASPEVEDLTLRTMLAVVDGKRSNDPVRTQLIPRNPGEPHASEMAHLLWLHGESGFPGERIPEIDWALEHNDTPSLAVFSATAQIEKALRAHNDLEALRIEVRILAIDPAHSVSRERIERIGVRRAADLALVEGMLIARRCGAAMGAPLLGFASAGFRECGEATGAFLAALEHAMARVALGEHIAPSALGDSYEACRAQAGDLPAWHELEAIAAVGATAIPDPKETAAALDALSKYGGWRPCLVRSIGVLVCAGELLARDTAGGAVREWIARHYSTQRDGETALAPDLARWAGGRLRATAWRRVWKITKDVMLGLLGLAFLLGGLALLIKGFGWAVTKTNNAFERTIGVRLADWIVVLILVNLGALVALRRRVLPWLFAPLTFFGRLRLNIAPAAGAADPNAPLRTPLIYRRQLSVWMLNWNVDAGEKPEALTGKTRDEPTVPACVEMREYLPASVAKDLASIRKLALPGGWRVRLQIEDELAGLPWEAAVALAGGALPFRETRFACRRVLASAESARLAPIGLPLPVVLWTYHEYLADVAGHAWSKVGEGAISISAAPQRDPPPAPGSHGHRACIVHLLGSPRETTVGVALSIANSTKDWAAGWETVQAGDLIQREPAVQLCILQAPLDEGIAQRTQQRRQEAALLRRFGAALFKTGIPAVLVLPPLTEALHHTAFEIVRAFVASDSPRTERHWLRMMRRVQEAIGAALAPPPPAGGLSEKPDAVAAREAALETAFDVSLYLIDNFTWNVRGKSDPAPAITK